jgi:hypothetical protein
MAITGIYNTDYFTASLLDISYSETTLRVGLRVGYTVAKSRYQRVSVSTEFFDGETITYSGYNNDNYRIATDSSSNSEFQVVFPRYTTLANLGFSTGSFPLTGSTAQTFMNSQCIIKAVNLPAGVGLLDDSGNQIYWEELTDRKWVRQYVQSGGD